jgi:hypothetical protein
MAQAGFTPISLYHSSTAAAAPLAANLANGELAINIADGKLYYKDNLGVVKSISGATATYTRTSFTATGGQTTFTVAYTVGFVQVYLNGVFLNGTDFTATNGTTVVLATGATAGDIVETVAYNIVNIGIANTATNLAGGIASQLVYQASAGSTAFIANGTSGQVLRSNGTAVPSWGTLTVAGGGTGLTTLTANNVILGNGTSNPTFVAPSTTGNVLTSNGTTWTSAAPAAGSKAADVQTFDSSGTWTKPTGYSADSRALIQVWGGGGSGAKGRAGGGGGGGYNERWINLASLGATETVTIGAGGTGITAAGTAGNVGGTSSFGSHISAFGGGGGDATVGGGGGGQLSAGLTAGAGGAPYAVTYPTLDANALPQFSLNNATLTYLRTVGSGSAYIMIGCCAFVALSFRNSAFMHGGGGGLGGRSPVGANALGNNSVHGGGGGGGNDASNNAGGTSSFGGAGGAGSSTSSGTAGTQPAGGGGATNIGATSGAGGAGRIIVTVFDGA